MRIDGRASVSAVTLLALGVITACDTGPMEPRTGGPAELAAAFAELPAGTLEDGVADVPCPAGGSFTFELEEDSFETVGDITIHRTKHTRRYNDCAMSRGSMISTASGEMKWTGESHLESPDAAWPDGVIYQIGHQKGTLTMTTGSSVQVCEYDLTQTSEPKLGHYSFRGTVCGYSRNRDIQLPR